MMEYKRTNINKIYETIKGYIGSTIVASTIIFN